MIFIAHRGNTNGSNPDFENKPDYIDAALRDGFDVEVDVWVLDGNILLGHDGPDTPVELAFLESRKSNLWCHAKNLRALEMLLAHGFNCFSHDADDYVLTSHGDIWAYPGKPCTNKCICVMPEWDNMTVPVASKGVCSDFVGKLRGAAAGTRIANSFETVSA